MTYWTENSRKLYRRWGSSTLPDYVSREEFGRQLGISIGLGAIYGENEEAEREWMNKKHPQLGCTPLLAVMRGRSDHVLEIVNRDRMP